MESSVLRRIDSIIRWTVIGICSAFLFGVVGLTIVIIVVLHMAGMV